MNDNFLTSRRRFISTLGAAAISPLTVTGRAFAATYPDKPITFICPWPAGGGTDVAMRALAEAAAKHLGQRVVIDNRPGAGGTVGPGNMARTAKPDGYTIAQMPISVLRMPYIQKVNYDPMEDFTWIIGITGYTFGVVVRADAPWKTWRGFTAYAKANPGKVSYSSPGTGTSRPCAERTVSCSSASRSPCRSAGSCT